MFSIKERSDIEIEIDIESGRTSTEVSHAKIPLEFLFFETGSVPINISSQRMITSNQFSGEMMKKSPTELLRNPCPGDYVKLIEKDFPEVGIIIGQHYKDVYRNWLVCKLRGHSKVDDK